MPKTIYEGSLSVEGDAYEDLDEEGNDYVAIANLDELVTRRSRLTFTLDYPFEKPYEGVVVGDAGVTLRQIIDAIRRSYHVMYRGARHEPIGNMANEVVDGDYGRAYHAMGDLVIEIIDLDESNGSLDINIGS